MSDIPTFTSIKSGDIGVRKFLYELIYRFFPVDWVFGSSSKIENFVDLAIDGRIESGTVITLGCGVGRETIYLAKKGFNVIGLDFSSTAIKRARRQAKIEGVDVKFIEDDLTALKHAYGKYDLVMDFGAFNDLGQGSRDLYMQNVIPLTRSGGYYSMFSFDKMLPYDEVAQRFGSEFSIEVIYNSPGGQFPGVLSLYWMTRNSENR